MYRFEEYVGRMQIHILLIRYNYNGVGMIHRYALIYHCGQISRQSLIRNGDCIIYSNEDDKSELIP